MVTGVLAVTAKVVMVNVVLVDPAGTMTLNGTLLTSDLSVPSRTSAPPTGAAWVSVTVACEGLPPGTLVGLKVKEATAAGGSPGEGTNVSQVSAIRWDSKIEPPCCCTGVTALTPMAAKLGTATGVVATVKPALVAPVGMGKKPEGVTLAETLLLNTKASAARGTGWDGVLRRTVPAEAFPPTRYFGLSATGKGGVVAQTSLKPVKLVASRVWQPRVHSCLKVQVPEVPKFGARLQSKRMPRSPALAGKAPPHIWPERWLVSLGKPPGRGCAVTMRVALCVVALCVAEMVTVKPSPL